ncbi:hypothetical protein BGZ83_001211, partial [Gryganskiella cystojenkinii]
MGANTNVLVKSNANPASLSDVTWTLISAVALDNLYIMAGLPLMGTFVCTADSSGVFTVLAEYSKYGTTDETPAKPRGLQYTPGTGSSKGTWANLDVSSGYSWTFQSSTVMFPIGTTVMQLYKTSIVADTLSYSILDKPTNKFIQSTTNITLDPTSGELVAYAYNSANSNIFILTDYITTTNYLSVAPISSTGTILSTSALKRVNANVGNCTIYGGAGTVKTAIYNNEFYLFCS